MQQMEFYLKLLPLLITIALGLIQSIAEYVFIKNLKDYSFHDELKTGNRTFSLFRMYRKSSDPEFKRKYRKKVLPFLSLTMFSLAFTLLYVLSKFL
jgi:hypothetical protein